MKHITGVTGACCYSYGQNPGCTTGMNYLMRENFLGNRLFYLCEYHKEWHEKDIIAKIG